MSILITGANGFVGRHAVEYFLKETKVRIFALTSQKARPFEHERLSYYETDLHDFEALRALMRELRPGKILHLAGQASVSRSFLDPVSTVRQNLEISLHLLEALRLEHPAAKILLVSSSEVYGSMAAGTVARREEDPLRPESPYAVSKAAAELAARQYAVSHGMKIVIARPFNHTGPGQSETFALPSFAQKLIQIKSRKAEPVIYTGNIEVERDFLDVRDVVRAYGLLLEKGKAGETYNVCSGKAQPLRWILEELISLFGREVEIRLDPKLERQMDIPLLVGDRRKITADTGWAPAIELSRTLKDLLDFFRKQK